MRKAELQAAIGKQVDVRARATFSSGFPHYYTGTLLDVGSDGWNKVDCGVHGIKLFKSVSIKRVRDAG
jgi:hypothetical protein